MEKDGKISVLDKGYVRLVDHMGSDLSIVNAARASFAKESTEFSQSDGKLIDFLARENHMSPFRHAFVTLEFYAPLMWTLGMSPQEDISLWTQSFIFLQQSSGD